MFKSLQANPVYRHLTANPRWPSPRLTWWIFGIVLIVSLGLTLPGLLMVVRGSKVLWSAPIWLSVIWFVILFISPFWVGFRTAPIVAKLIDSTAYDLIRITPLESSMVIKGMMGAALYRLRVFWAVCGGITPGIFLSELQTELFHLSIDPNYQCSLCSEIITADLILTGFASALLVVIIAILLAGSYYWFSMCFAIWITIRYPNRRTGASIFAVIFISYQLFSFVWNWLDLLLVVILMIILMTLTGVLLWYRAKHLLIRGT